MQYVGKVFSTVSQLYKELNPATLSGAIDIIVVEGKDGELSCSPFHVRFGKLQLLRPSDKAVQVIVNGKAAEFYMKVGVEGEGFFVLETQGEVPSEFATSPVASPTLSFRDGEDPDFLDLGSVPGGMPGDANDGYVSAPSAHESEDESWSADEQPPVRPMRPVRRHMRRVSSASAYMPCATPSADRVGTAAYAEPGDGMWLPQNSDGPAPVTFLDDTAVGTRFKARGGAVVDASLEQIKLGLRGQAAVLEQQEADTRPRRPMSVVSDSAYVLDPFSGADIPADPAEGGAHTGWDWGVPAQELAADEAKEEQPAADEAREGQPVATSTACSLDMSRMLASLGNPGAQPLAISLCGIQAL
ncbi:lipin Ned1, partial [Linderina pennispora]